MIFTCETRCCHYLFLGSEQTDTCPDCGKKRIRPATHRERAEFFRRQTANYLHPATPLGNAGSALRQG